MKKKSPKQIEYEFLAEKKNKLHIEWQEYLSQLSLQNYDRKVLEEKMKGLNNIDKEILNRNIKELLY